MLITNKISLLIDDDMLGVMPIGDSMEPVNNLPDHKPRYISIIYLAFLFI